MLPWRVFSGTFRNHCMRPAVFDHRSWKNVISSFCRTAAGYVEIDDWLYPERKRFGPDGLIKGSLIVGIPKAPGDINSLNPLMLKNYDGMPPIDENITKFSEVPLCQTLKYNLSLHKIDTMTPVQRYAVHAISNGFDLMAIAETGTGKTFAFLVPLINSIMNVYPEEAMNRLKEEETVKQYPLALILAPSIDLVVQIDRECKRLLYGSSLITHHLQRLQRQKPKDLIAHIVITTPSLLMKSINSNYVSLEFCRFLVVDQGNSFSRSYIRDNLFQVIASPLANLPPPQCRQTALFASIFNAGVYELATSLLKPNFVKIMPDSRKGGIPKKISHSFIWSGELSIKEKFELLPPLLNEIGDKGKILIFCADAKGEDLETMLTQKGFQPLLISRKQSISDRIKKAYQFNLAQSNILICLPRLAYGFDFVDVKFVINLSINSVEAYIHQIGRTGRFGKVGYAVTFIGEKDMHLADDLVILLESLGTHIPDFLLTRKEDTETSDEI